MSAPLQVRPDVAEKGCVSFLLDVPGQPQGKARPRFVKQTGRTYTPAATVLAESEVRRQWEAAGEPRIHGPVALSITLVMERPAGHFRTDGVSLSAQGLRHPRPDVQKPDADNALKLVMDALNKRAWSDDVRVVDARVRRVWGDRARTIVQVEIAGA